jgi:hypothetical protein
MTQAEIEAELTSQRQQLLQMQQQLQKSKENRRRFAQIVGGVGLLFMATAIIMEGVMAHPGPAPFISVLILTSITLIFIASAIVQ